MLPRGERRGGGAAGGGHEESDEKASARGKGLPIHKYLFSSIDQLAYMRRQIRRSMTQDFDAVLTCVGAKI